MASFAIHFFILSLSLFSVSCFSLSDEPQPLILPIKKDPATNLFYTTVSIGTPLHKMDLVIDLGGPFLWYDCDSHYNSSSYRPILCDSKECPKSSSCIGCNGDFKPGCTNNTCGLDILNPLATSIFSGGMGEDVIFVSHAKLPRLLSGCTDSDGFTGDSVLQGLPKASKGIIGLARTQLAFPTQFALNNKLPRKFALCFSSSNGKGFGKIFVGSGGLRSLSKIDLLTTPLIINPVSTAPIFTEGEPSYEYFIHVEAILVDGEELNLKPSLLSIDEKGNGGTKISTMNPFTVLHSSIYKPLVRRFVKAASERKIKQVASVAPFGACFDSSTIKKTDTGLDVPSIDLRLVGGRVGWSIGDNSVVRVNKNVMCLGFVDGGKVTPRSVVTTSIVIGGHALENNLFVFDLASLTLGFTNSLLPWGASCSDSSVFSF